MPKKVKPKKSEFERGRERGIAFGIKTGCDVSCILFLLALIDKHGFSKEDIQYCYSNVVSYAQAVKVGTFKIDKMREVLLKDYDIDVNKVKECV